MNLEEAQLSELELFELKRFLLQTELIYPVLEEVKAKAHIQGIDIPAQTEALKLMDPEGNRAATFFISDNASGELKAARRLKKELEEKLRRENDPDARAKLTAERSLAAANDVMAALKEAEHEPELFQADGSLIDDLLRAQPDAAISCLRGGDGESGDIQDALSVIGLPCVGSSAAVCRLAYDKASLSEVLQAYHNLTEDLVTATVPQTLTFSRRAFELWGMEAALSQVESRFPDSFPLCVKPASGSSAHGVSRVEDAEQLAEALREALKISERALVQPWVEGVQLCVPVIGTGWNAFALPPVEIVAKEGWYDAAARQAADAVELHVPVRNESLSPSEADAQAIRAEIERAVLETYRALGMRDCGCIDLTWDGAQAIILEAVANPCLSAEAPFAQAAKAAGLTLPNLLNELVESALDA